MIFSDKAQAALARLLSAGENPFYQRDGMTFMRFDSIEFGAYGVLTETGQLQCAVKLYWRGALLATLPLPVTEGASVTVTGIEGQMRTTVV